MADEVVNIKIELDNGQVLEAFDRAKKRAEDSAKEIEQALGKAGANSSYADRVFGNFQKKAEEASKNALTGKSIDLLKNNAQNAGVQVSQAFNGGFSNKLKDLIGTVSKEFPSIGNVAQKAFGIVEGGIGSLIGPLAILAGSLLIIKKSIEDAFEGEKLLAAEVRFNKLAESAGLSGFALEQAFTKAAGGLVDTSDIIKTASLSLATFGSNAEKLPQLFEVSKKAAILLGQDTLTTFDNLSTAIQNGNQRALKNQGIILDTDKVYKQYAKSLGLVASELNENQKQAALLDAVLEKSKTTYSGVVLGITPANVALKELGVTLNEIFEASQKRASELLSGPIAAVLKASNGFLKNFLPETSAEGAVRLNKEIDDLTSKIIAAKTAGEKFVPFQGAQLSINDANRALGSLLENFSALPEAARKAALGIKEAQKESFVDPKKLTDEQIAARNARDAALKSEILNTQSATLASQQALLQYEDDFNARKLEKQRINQEQIRILNEQEQAKLTQIDQQYKTGQITNESLYNELRLAQQADFEARRTKVISDGNDALVKQSNDTKQRLQIIQNGLNSIIADGAVALGNSLSQAGNSFENFGKAIAGIIADQIITLGKALIIQGLAIETFVQAINSLLPGSGAAAAAAGLGLVLFGTALKSAVGGGASSTSSGGGVAVGGGGLTSPATPVTDNPQTVAQEPSTKVNVVINGSVLDSDETGLRIVDLLNNAFDKQGVQVRQSA